MGEVGEEVMFTLIVYMNLMLPNPPAPSIIYEAHALDLETCIATGEYHIFRKKQERPIVGATYSFACVKQDIK